MFEGFVSQVLEGYLGRYVKGIQKEQLRIGIWSEEVLLDNVELMLEAFDYLQLPFALKEGKIGKLSIKIPWKKLGWDPIVIVLEDIFLCACSRDNHEWSLEAVEKRELAGKMAKLNTAELAKFSKRVYGNQIGQSFIAKILDNIQVSMKNVHVVYTDTHAGPEKILFGLRFSSLTIMTDTRKQSSSGSSYGKLKSGKVQKILRISTFGIYCNLLEDDTNIDGVYVFSSCCDSKLDPKRYDYLINPFDLTVSLLVNKSGMLDSTPQYSIQAELTSVVVLLNETQLRQILSLWDHFSTCLLRAKYGRYRPDYNSLLGKIDGWQILWWHYAQQSVLADVRRRLRKTSWSSLGRRITDRRKYVNLYRRKLEMIQQDQHVNKDILEELEQMDKECEIDEILTYRSIAENQVQEFLLQKQEPSISMNDVYITQEKGQSDERRLRGWLNWLSLGMLGAGGTADSSSFVGLVSDEIIKDIYKATESHPFPAGNKESSTRNKILSFLIKFDIDHVTMTIGSKKEAKEIALVLFDGVGLEYRIWEDFSSIAVLMNSVKIISPCKDIILLSIAKITNDSVPASSSPCLRAQIKAPAREQAVDLSMEAVLHCIEVTYDADFIGDLFEFLHALETLDFQNQRVLSSFNGFEQVNARLLSKAEYIFLTRKKVIWDIEIHGAIIKLPQQCEDSTSHTMVLKLGTLHCLLRPKMKNDPPMLDIRENFGESLMNILSAFNLPSKFELEDLYDHFEIDLIGFEGNIMTPNSPCVLQVFERFDAHVIFRFCMFLDESMLKQAEVHCSVSSLSVHMSPLILGVLANLGSSLLRKNLNEDIEGDDDLHITSDIHSSGLNISWFSASLLLDHFSLFIGLEDDSDINSLISVTLLDTNIRYTFREFEDFRFLVKMIKVSTDILKGAPSGLVLCSTRNSTSKSYTLNAEEIGHIKSRPAFGEQCSPADEYFLFHYQSSRNGAVVLRKYGIFFNDVDFDIYPTVIGMLLESCNRISAHGNCSHGVSTFSIQNSPKSVKIEEKMMAFDSELQDYDISRFCDTVSKSLTDIPFIPFPFATSGIGLSGNTGCSFIPNLPGWNDAYVINKGFSTSEKIDIIKKSIRGVDTFIVDFHLKEVRVHFHDSSCILVSINLPLCASSSCFHGIDSWEVWCYIDGLKLSSPWSNTSWSSPNIPELLWGPALPSISPLLNIHVKKGKGEAAFSAIEISIVFQHVSCILPSEFLAMVIGYFCLPEWTLERNELSVTENEKFEDCHLSYKFEIRDSSLVIPIENCEDYCLKLGFPHVQCSFIPGICSVDALRGIPDDCVIPNIKLADMLHLVNVSVRGTSLSVLLLKDGKIPLTSDEYSCVRNVSLISKLDADLWIRIPCGSEHRAEQYADPTFIMLKADACNLVIEDEYFVQGLEATGNAIEWFSTVGDDSRNFKSDVLQFIQLKKRLKEVNAVTELPTETVIVIKICTNALSLKLMGHSSEIIAGVNLKIVFSAILINEMMHKLDADILYAVLHSSMNSVVLLSFVSEDSSSSIIRINFCKSDKGANEIDLCFPFLDIWFHLSDWNKVIDHLVTCQGSSNSTSWPSSDGSPSEPESKNVSEASISLTSYASENDVQEAAHLIVKSDKTVLSIHFPVWHGEENFADNELNESKDFHYHMLAEDMPSLQVLCSRYLTITLQSRDMKLSVSNRVMAFKCSTGRMKILLERIEEHNVKFIPFIQISLIKVAAEIHEKSQKVGLTISDIQVETLDLYLSQQMFKLWDNIPFAASGASHSEMFVQSLTFQVQLTKCSLLLSDRRWRCNGSIFDITVKNLLMDGQVAKKFSVESELSVNYNNIQKAMWEPFVEPWRFCLSLMRCEGNTFLSKSGTREMYLESQQELNLNITESVIEDIFLVYQMIKGFWNLNESYKLHEHQGRSGFKNTENAFTIKHAPYIICNDTSLPLLFWVSYGPANAEGTDVLSMKQGNTVLPGFSVPIYVEEPPENHLHNKAAYSSERLMERKMGHVAHHLISIQLDGTSNPSKPMSMDLVGVSYFEVNFLKSRVLEMVDPAIDDEASQCSRDSEELHITHSSSGLVVPVVFDVSMHCYSKMIRLYSTVILLNATSQSLELRFDIPFGVSPKILGPIHPGQEFPLPVHLAEAVGMRWRPVDSDYFWSEAHLLSKILTHENRPGFMRSFVCYPSCPKSDPFRCCISIQDCSVLHPYGSKKGSSLHIKDTSNVAKIHGQNIPSHDKSKKQFIRQVRLTTPLLVKNDLPTALSLTIDSGGFTTSVCLSEMDTASIFQLDSTNDLEITLHLQGCNPATAKFPRAETFTAMSRLHDTKFSLSEQITVHPARNNGPICLRVDKLMDAFSGAREMWISVPFLLYNCTGLPLAMVDDDVQHLGHACLIQSSYSVMENERPFSGKYGISLFSPDTERLSTPLTASVSYALNHHSMPMSRISKPCQQMFLNKHVMEADSSENVCGRFDSVSVDRMESHANFSGIESGINHLNSPANSRESENERKVKAFMYSPPSHLSDTDLMVRLQKYSPKHRTANNWDDTWSSPFSLVPASGSANIIIPQRDTTGAFLVSVTSNKVSGILNGRTRAIIFQPRYVLCNACSKDLYYKQKGTSDSHSFRLGVRQHSHLHWTDRTRDLLVSVRFDERGSQWSGSFLPDCLGDAQVKVRNYVSGVLDMVRVEIQNADLSIDNEKIIGTSNRNSGTYLILLSDDDSGFMPYRIDNFSMESLRIYQRKCEAAETIVHSYTSCQYAWDEPCYPHRLTVEVPGERILGSYFLDTVKEYTPVVLPPSSEKPERRFFVAIHADGATKVLSIIDSRYHSLSDIKEIGFLGFREERKSSQQKERSSYFSESVILHFTFIGISLINSSPQELVYACAKDTQLIVMQSPDKQKISFQISSLQIDNQLRNAPYPILLSFDHEYKPSSPNLKVLGTQNEDAILAANHSLHESGFYFDACKWRKKEPSFVSYEYVNLRVAPVNIQLEEQVFLHFLDFLRAISSRLQTGILQNGDSKNHSQENCQHCKHYLHDDDEEMCERFMISCQFHSFKEIRLPGSCTSNLPSVVPIGAPWQQIYRLARRQKKIYIEAFELTPIKLTVSFSSNPWLIRKEGLTEAESIYYFSSSIFQRGLMALVDIEGVPFNLKELTLTHLMASQQSIQDIVTKHYARQLLHEIYKVFGSAGLIGNPIGFARNVGLGIKDFLSVSSKSIVQSPTGLITGVAQGSKSLLSNTIYAVSSAASQFSKAVHKGIVAFTFDEQSSSKMEKQENIQDSHGRGILNEFLEGLTGLLQSPIRGAEKHGLPGVVSGIVLGTAGLVARPMASILETTGKTAQSIRKRSSPHQSNCFRVRLPRPLARELPLSPYSWEEAIGVSMLLEADSCRLGGEIFVKCRALKQDGKFVVITERLVMIVSCPDLVGFGKPGFIGIADLTWVTEMEMCIDSIIHIDREVSMVNIVGSKAETISRQKKSNKVRMWNLPTSIPLFHMSMLLSDEEKAEDVLQTLWSLIEQGKTQKLRVEILHRSNLK